MIVAIFCLFPFCGEGSCNSGKVWRVRLQYIMSYHSSYKTIQQRGRVHTAVLQAKMNSSTLMQVASDNAFQDCSYEVDHEGCGLMLEALQEHLRLVEVRISSSYHRYQH